MKAVHYITAAAAVSTLDGPIRKDTLVSVVGTDEQGLVDVEVALARGCSQRIKVRQEDLKEVPFSRIEDAEARVIRRYGNDFGFTAEPHDADVNILRAHMRYDSLNDAARYCPTLAAGDVEVLYVNHDHGYARDITFKPAQYVTKDGLAETHKVLGRVQETDLERLFQCLQGEFWSPAGQANSLIRDLGLHHTSMSVGDAVRFPDGRVFVVESCGFAEVTK